MNIGPINTSIPAATGVEGGSIEEAVATGDSSGGNSGHVSNSAAITKEDIQQSKAGPAPLKQMATSDFLSLRETFGTESVMDKLAKIFETILALRILEETIENVGKSIDEQTQDKEK